MRTVVDWPRYVGGPLAGERVLRMDLDIIMYEEPAPESSISNTQTIYYRERKLFVVPGELAIRVWICETVDPGEHYIEFMRDFSTHALASIGVDWP